LALLLPFLTSVPDLGAWPDYWVSVEFLHAPIPRRASGSTTTRWWTDERYCKAKQMLKNLPVVNDAAKRALGVATKLNNKDCPTDEIHVQALYKLVKGNYMA